MKVIEVGHGQGSYPVYVGQGLLGTPSIVQRHLRGRILALTDDRVAELYLDALRPTLTGQTHHHSLILPHGEEHKTLASWQRIIDALVDLGAQRDATVVALGGGVIGDIGGFAAASYMRGIRIVQVPTTLLAQVDASIGGKTGVNHSRGKNLIGAFHAPTAVIADTDTLTSLDPRDYRAGMAEVVKYGAIRDPAFFDWLEAHADALNQHHSDSLIEAVYQSVRNKAEVVAADERETGQRALLNFGHTFGHALETATGYREYRHGEAVAIGMVLAARLSELLGLCEAGTAQRMTDLLEKLQLPVALPEHIDPEHLLELMRLDKKNMAEQIRLILLDRIGQARILPCPAADIIKVMQT